MFRAIKPNFRSSRTAGPRVLLFVQSLGPPQLNSQFEPVITGCIHNRMKPFGGKINENYGWELVLFWKLREFSDGVTFLDMTIDWDRYLADHCPRFRIHIVVLNFTVLEASIYYLHHRDEENIGA